MTKLWHGSQYVTWCIFCCVMSYLHLSHGGYFLWFVFVFCQSCILLNLYFVMSPFSHFVTFVICHICILADAHFGVVAFYHICIASRKLHLPTLLHRFKAWVNELTLISVMILYKSYLNWISQLIKQDLKLDQNQVIQNILFINKFCIKADLCKCLD